MKARHLKKIIGFMDDNADITTGIAKSIVSSVRGVDDESPIFKLFLASKGVTGNLLAEKYGIKIRIHDLYNGTRKLSREEIDALIEVLGEEVCDFFEPAEFRLKSNADFLNSVE